MKWQGHGRQARGIVHRIEGVESPQPIEELLHIIDVVEYLDIGASFLEPDGSLSREIMPDLLHLSEEGYGIWAEAMEPSLSRLLNR